MTPIGIIHRAAGEQLDALEALGADDICIIPGGDEDPQAVVLVAVGPSARRYVEAIRGVTGEQSAEEAERG